MFCVCGRCVTARRFDIKSFDKNFENESNFDSEGFAQSKALVDDIIDREVQAGIPPNRIIVGGFSQGGAVALFTGLQAQHSLAGLLVMSSWMPARWRFPGKKYHTFNTYELKSCVNI
jgi:predicted esterase